MLAWQSKKSASHVRARTHTDEHENYGIATATTCHYHVTVIYGMEKVEMLRGVEKMLPEAVVNRLS